MTHDSPFNGYFIFDLKPQGRKQFGCSGGVCKGILKTDVRKVGYKELEFCVHFARLHFSCEQVHKVVLHSVEWSFFADVSGQYVGPDTSVTNYNLRCV
jgi:hypothetical protein